MTRRRRTSNRTQRHRKKVSKKYRTKKYQRVRIQKKSKTSRKTRRRRRKTFKKGGAFCTRKSPQDFCDEGLYCTPDIYELGDGYR